MKRIVICNVLALLMSSVAMRAQQTPAGRYMQQCNAEWRLWRQH